MTSIIVQWCSGTIVSGNERKCEFNKSEPSVSEALNITLKGEVPTNSFIVNGGKPEDNLHLD